MLAKASAWRVLIECVNTFYKQERCYVVQAKKHFSPKLKQLSAEAGIALKVIDLDKSFEEQEPFDVLLHKVRSQGNLRLCPCTIVCCSLHNHSVLSKLHQNVYLFPH